MPEIRPYGAQCDECKKCYGTGFNTLPGAIRSELVPMMVAHERNASYFHFPEERDKALRDHGWYLDGRNMVCPNCRPNFEERKTNPIVVIVKSDKVEE